MKTEFYLSPYGSGTFELIDLPTEVPLPHSKSIIDLTSLEGGPGELLSGGSRTLKLPGTKINNQVFGHIFDINIADCSFDTRKKAECIVYIDGLLVVEGVLRLEKVNRIKDFIEYECQITEGLRSFYNAMVDASGNDALLTDLIVSGETEPYSSLNHTYDYATQEASFAPGIIPGSSLDGTGALGYIYPLIDYGETDNHAFYVENMYPAIFVKEYIDRIFQYCGFTYSSTFFGTTFFKSLIIPFCNNNFVLTNAEYAIRYFHVSLQSGSVTILAASGLVKIPFNRETTPDSDPSNQYDNVTNFRWTVPTGKSGLYDIHAIINWTKITGTDSGTIYIKLNGSTTVQSVPIPANASGTYSINRVYHLNAGDYIEIFVATGGVSSGSADNGSVFYDLPQNTLTAGDAMDMINAVPVNIKAKDFFESICKMFNLQVEINSNINNEVAKCLVIEPWGDFYNGLVDWTNKWDTSQEVAITPMGLLNSKNYLFTYSADSDYWNKYYTDRHYTLDHNDIYGERQLTTDNDYLTDNKKTEIIFAPTPLALYNTGVFAPSGVPNTKILSTIHMGSSGGNDPVTTAYLTPPVKPAANIIRILQYGGRLTGAWAHWDGATWQPKTVYPYAGHFDNPSAPTIDINFGLTAELFYIFSGITVTDNNLYNTYYSQQINEITDPDSKVVELYVKLNASDLCNLSFRNLIFIDKTAYKLLEITDFDLGKAKTTKVKLLKTIIASPNTVSTGVIIGGGGGVGGEILPIPQGPLDFPYIQPGAVSRIGGDGNYIGGAADQVMIHSSDNNTVFWGKGISIFGGGSNIVSGNNITLINCSGMTINESDVVYVNGVKYQTGSALTGVATMALGTVTVAYTGITASSVITGTWNGTGVLTGVLSIVPGVDQFTINSSNGGDTAHIAWSVEKI